MYRLILLSVLVVGCGSVTAPRTDPAKPAPPDVPLPNLEQFDAAKASDELAKQAEKDNSGVAILSSDSLDGILNQAAASGGLDKAWISRVRTAVPGIGSHPVRKLTPAEIATIRATK